MTNTLNFNEEYDPAEVADQLERAAESGHSVRIMSDELRVVVDTIRQAAGIDVSDGEVLAEEPVDQDRLDEELKGYEPDVEPVVEGSEDEEDEG